MRAALGSALAFVALASASLVGPSRASAESGTSIAAVQESLVWLGLSQDQINGRSWPSAAVRRFQARLGHPATGRLTGEEADILFERAEEARHAVDLEPYADPLTGVRVGIPRALTPEISQRNGATRFASRDGKVEIELVHLSQNPTWDAFIAQGKAARPDLRITYSARGEGWLVITGFMGSRQFYSRVQRGPDGLRGFAVTYEGSTERVVEPVIVVMASTFARPELLAGN